MNISKELYKKAEAAKTAEELLELVKAENIEMTKEDAARAFAKLHENGELSDNELDDVSGGGDCAKGRKGESVVVDGKKGVIIEEYSSHYSHYYCKVRLEDGKEIYAINRGDGKGLVENPNP